MLDRIFFPAVIAAMRVGTSRVLNEQRSNGLDGPNERIVMRLRESR